MNWLTRRRALSIFPWRLVADMAASCLLSVAGNLFDSRGQVLALAWLAWSFIVDREPAPNGSFGFWRQSSNATRGLGNKNCHVPFHHGLSPARVLFGAARGKVALLVRIGCVHQALLRAAQKALTSEQQTSK